MGDSKLVVEEFRIENRLGLHMRSAAMVVRVAEGFKSRVTLKNADTVADAGSVLDLLTLAAGMGAVITIEAEGPDAEEAVRVLGDLIRRGFAD
ncbi:MAG: HPr family phosphocarrier protein [Candidatus Binatia bacterium]